MANQSVLGRTREASSWFAAVEVVSALLLLLLCAPCSPRETSFGDQLVGAWHLETLGGTPAADSAIRQWTIIFRPDGSWSYAGWLKGPWQGMHVSGQGTWKLTRRTLEFTAGNSSGAAVIDVSRDALVLTPDPVLTSSKGGGAVSATYRRETSRN